MFSALGPDLHSGSDGQHRTARLTHDAFGEFQPSWSPDGRSIVYVRWTARDGGQIYRVDANGAKPPMQLTTTPAYYTSPVFTPDGHSIVAVRSSNYVRMHRYMEYGPLRDAELVVMPASGGEQRVIAQGSMGGTPHFGPDRSEVDMLFDDGLNARKSRRERTPPASPRSPVPLIISSRTARRSTTFGSAPMESGSSRRFRSSCSCSRRPVKAGENDRPRFAGRRASQAY